MPALISGNTVVLKPAEDTPLSSYNLVQILAEAGVPEGVVNLVSGNGPNAGAPLAEHLDVPVVSFTGSTAVGRLIAEACAPEFKHCSLEMGGKNIIIVMEDANLDLAVDGAIWGGFGTTGQRCTAASRIAVHKAVYHDFTSRFVARAKKLKAGNGLDPGIDMGPCINEQQLKTVMDYVQIGQAEGAKLLTGGHRLTEGPYAKGWFHEATVFGDCNPKMRVAQEEIFGPVVSLIPISSLEEAIEVEPFAICSPASSTSMPRPSAPKRTCPSAAPRKPATATAKPPSPPSTSTPSGRRCTSTTPTSFSAPKSTTRSDSRPAPRFE